MTVLTLKLTLSASFMNAYAKLGSITKVAAEGPSIRDVASVAGTTASVVGATPWGKSLAAVKRLTDATKSVTKPTKTIADVQNTGLATSAPAAIKQTSDIASSVGNVATPAARLGARVLPALEPVSAYAALGAKGVSRVAAPVGAALTAYQTSQLAADPAERARAYSDQTAAARQGYVTSVAQATSNPAGAVYTLGKEVQQLADSRGDAAKAAERGRDYAQETEEVERRRRSAVSDAQFAAMPQGYKSYASQRLRQSVRAGTPWYPTAPKQLSPNYKPGPFSPETLRARMAGAS